VRISTLVTTASLATFITAASFVTGLRSAEPQLILAPPSDISSVDENAQQQLGLEEPASPDVIESPIPESPASASPVPSSDAVEASPSTTQADEKSQPASTATQVAEPAQPEPPPEPEPVAVSIDSETIAYKYGNVQVRLVVVGIQITEVTVLQGDTSYGRDVAYATLVQATLQYQGTNYGNVSGATFTTEAFKLAVESALRKS
jgi:hypothetical protein